jgi:ferredoxin-type protein NapG
MTDSPDSKPLEPAPPPPPPVTEIPAHAPEAPVTEIEKAAPNTHSPVTRVQKPKAAVIIAIQERQIRREPPPQARRDFFDEAMREALGPLSGMLERKINPLLAALEALPGAIEALPDEVDRMANVTLPAVARALDQPLLSGRDDSEEEGVRTIPLPLANSIANSEPRYLRPPGAIPAGEFEATCIRCGKCAAACPAEAILLDPSNFIHDGHPYIEAANRSCVVCNSLACMNVCPTGALKPLDRLSIDMGTARVDPQQCRRDSGEDCRLCVEACPIVGEGAPPEGDAIVISPQTGRVHVRKNICIGCGLCESQCPTEPRAIWVVPPGKRVEPIVA